MSRCRHKWVSSHPNANGAVCGKCECTKEIVHYNNADVTIYRKTVGNPIVGANYTVMRMVPYYKRIQWK